MSRRSPEQRLDDYATDSLKTMARRRGWREAATAGKAGLIAFLGPRVFSPEANRQLVLALPPRQRQLLAALKARGSRADVVTLTAAVDGEADEIAEDIRDLVEQGLLLYPPREGNGRKYRLGDCPRVCLDASTAAAIRAAPPPADVPRLLAQPPASIVEPFAGLLLADMVLTLDGFRRHAVPPPSPDGAVGRPWRALVDRLLQPSPESHRPGVLAPRVAFLYALLGELGLAVVRGGLLVASDTARDFFHRPRHEQWRALMDAWRATQQWNEFERIPELVPRPVPDDSHGLHTPTPGQVARSRDKVLAALERFTPGHWYAFSSLTRELKQHDPDFLIRREAGGRHGDATYRGFGQRGRGDTALPLDLTTDWDRVEGRFLARLLLEPLHWLGLVRLGFEHPPSGTPTAPEAFAVTPQGAALLGLQPFAEDPMGAGPLLVQPDFTLLCMAPEPDPGMLDDLTRFADYDGGDRVARFTLCRESVQRGLHQGWTAAGIGRVLHRASAAPLPQNIVASLGEWEASHRRFRIVRGVTLLEDPHGLLARLPAGSPLATRTGPRLAPGVFRPDGPRAGLLSALRQARVPVRHMDYSSNPGRVLNWENDETPRVLCSPRGDDWLTRSLLERIARPDENHPGLWHPDRRCVRRAVDKGMPMQDLLQGLEARSRPLPPSIRLLISAWCRDAAPVGLTRVALFSCQDTALREMILAVPELAADLLEQVADDTFVVRSGRMTALRRNLKRYGISLRRDGRVRPPAAPTARRRPAPEEGTLPFRWNRADAPADMTQAQGHAPLRFLLLRAIQSRRKVRLRARGPRGKTAQRELAPLALDGSMLKGRCLATGKSRQYTLDGIEAVELLPDRFSS